MVAYLYVWRILPVWLAAMSAAGVFAIQAGMSGPAIADSTPRPRVFHAIDRYPYVLWRETWAGAELQARSWSVYSGTTIALGGDIEDPGWRLRSTAGYGRYSYRKLLRGYDGPERAKLYGQKAFSSVLLGYQFRFNQLTLKAFSGIASDQHLIDPRDPEPHAFNSSYGGKAALEAWYNISKRGWIAADVSFATTSNTYKLGIKSGYRLFPMLDVGIEARIEGDDDYRAGRAGGFATIGILDGGLTIAGGATGDRDMRHSHYASISLFYRY